MPSKEKDSAETKSIFPSAFKLVLLAIIIMSAFFSWHISVSLSERNYIPEESALNILKALLDAEIALVGLWGIILVFIFNALYGAKENVSKNKFELEVRRDSQVIKLGAETVDQLKPLWEKYKSRIDELDEEYNQLIVQTFTKMIVVLGTTMLLLLSIFQNIFSTGLITNNGLYYWNLIFCLFPLFLTIFLMFQTTIFSLPQHEFDILKKELKKQWQKVREKKK